MSCFFHDASIPWYLLLYVKFYQCNACQIFNIIFNYDLTIILCGKILFWIFFFKVAVQLRSPSISRTLFGYIFLFMTDSIICLINRVAVSYSYFQVVVGFSFVTICVFCL